MIKLKTILSEGFAWERKPGKPLPTLAEVQAEYEHNIKETEESNVKPDFIDLDKDGNETEPMKQAAEDAKESNMNEAYGMSYDEAVAQAKEVASKEGIAQHVNKIGDDLYIVDEFMDGDNTVASYGLGMYESFVSRVKKNFLGGALRK